MESVILSVWGQSYGWAGLRTSAMESSQLSKVTLSVKISAPPLCSQHKGKVKSCQGSLKANEEFTRSSGFHSW